MEEYIRFMNRKNAKTAVKIMLLCAAVFFAGAAVAYCNTRYNGFGDVMPAAAYAGAARRIWEWICECLFSYSHRFINIFK